MIATDSVEILIKKIGANQVFGNAYKFSIPCGTAKFNLQLFKQ